MLDEEAKVGWRALVAAIIGITVLCGIAVGGISVYQWIELGSADAPKEEPTPLTFKGPLLESEEGEVLRRVRREEKELLENYRWIDRENGTAQIPIEAAMELMVSRGGTP